MAQKTAGWKSNGKGRTSSLKKESEVLRPLKGARDCINVALGGTDEACVGLNEGERGFLSRELGLLLSGLLRGSDAVLVESSWLMILGGSGRGKVVSGQKKNMSGRRTPAKIATR